MEGKLENIHNKVKATELVNIQATIIDCAPLRSLKCLAVESKNMILLSDMVFNVSKS